MKRKVDKEASSIDIECLKCKHFLGKCGGKITSKVIPCLCFDEKSK